MEWPSEGLDCTGVEAIGTEDDALSLDHWGAVPPQDDAQLQSQPLAANNVMDQMVKARADDSSDSNDFGDEDDAVESMVANAFAHADYRVLQGFSFQQLGNQQDASAAQCMDNTLHPMHAYRGKSLPVVPKPQRQAELLSLSLTGALQTSTACLRQIRQRMQQQELQHQSLQSSFQRSLEDACSHSVIVEQQVAELSAEAKGLRYQVESHSRKADRYKQKFKRSRREVTDLQQQLASCGQEAVVAKEELASISVDAARLREQLAASMSHTEDLQQLEEQLAAVKSKAARRKKKNVSLKLSSKALKKQLRAEQRMFHDFDHHPDLSNARLASLKARNHDLLQHKAALNRQVASLQQPMESAQHVKAQVTLMPTNADAQATAQSQRERQQNEHIQQLRDSLAALQGQKSALLVDRRKLHNRVAAAENAAAIASSKHQTAIAAAQTPHAVAVSQRQLAEGATEESAALTATQLRVFSIAADARAALPDQHTAAAAAAKEAIAVIALAGDAAAEGHEVPIAAVEAANPAAEGSLTQVTGDQAAAAEAANKLSAVLAGNKRLKAELKASVDTQHAALTSNSPQMQPHQTGNTWESARQLTRLLLASAEPCHTDLQPGHMTMPMASAPAEEATHRQTSEQVAAAPAHQPVKAPGAVLGESFLALMQNNGAAVQDQVAALQTVLKQLQQQQSAVNQPSALPPAATADGHVSQDRGPLREGIAQQGIAKQGTAGDWNSLKGLLMDASAAKPHDMPLAAGGSNDCDCTNSLTSHAARKGKRQRAQSEVDKDAAGEQQTKRMKRDATEDCMLLTDARVACSLQQLSAHSTLAPSPERQGQECTTMT